MGNAKLEIGGVNIAPGERKRIEIPIASLFDYTRLAIPVEVIRGGKKGPTMFVSAAIHGDEIIGVEVVKRLLARKELKKVRGTLIVVPIVNPFGYNNNIRYLPDRRDLNRCFPGSSEGSLASRIAYIFMKEIISKCEYGVDIHSGAIHRFNLPQVRLEIGDTVEMSMARAFGAPVVVNSPLRDGTLRQSAAKAGIKTILYEAGEALRFDDNSINIGVQGIINVMREVGLLKRNETFTYSLNVMVAKSSYWLRAPESGSLRINKKLGSFVQPGELVGVISDPYGDRQVPISTETPGIVICLTTMPLVNKGNAVIHVATLEDLSVSGRDVGPTAVFDEDIDIENEDWFNR
jgi:predicted deacylase